MHKTKTKTKTTQVRNVLAWIVNELNWKFLFWCIKLIENWLMKVTVICFLFFVYLYSKKFAGILFKYYLLTTEFSSYFLTFQQALHFNSVFLPRDIISRIALLKILFVAPKRRLKAFLHRINPQAHLSATKAHSLLQVDTWEFSLSPLRTKIKKNKKRQLYLAQGIAICMH